MRFITDAEVESKLDMLRAISVVEQAFKDYQTGDLVMSPKQYVDVPDYNGDFRAMPAYYRSKQLAGIKWVNSHVNNRDLPVVMAHMFVNDAKTGELLKTLEATSLTAIRTGAAGGVAVKALSPGDSNTIALVGAGVQAYYQAKAICCVRDIKHIRICDLRIEASESLKKRLLSEFKGDITCYTNVMEAVKDVPIIITTTPSRNPVVMADMVARGAHINAIGADAPGKQELDPMLMQVATVIVDDVEQASHSGEINVPLHDGTLNPEDIAATLGQVLSGEIDLPKDREFTVFDSTGLAIQDLACAAIL